MMYTGQTHSDLNCKLDRILNMQTHLHNMLHHISEQTDLILTAVEVDQPAIAEQVAKLKESKDALTTAMGNIAPAKFNARPEIETMNPLDTLAQQVTANTDAEASAVIVLNDLAAKLAAAKNDPVKIQALSDQLKASSDKLAAAIVASTPAA